MLNECPLAMAPARTLNPIPPADDATELDREQSWLIFNQRVLQMALDSRTPLLEKLAFLAIFTSNLDEYFMKRVGAFHKRRDLGRQRNAIDTDAVHQIEQIRTHVLELLEIQQQAFKKLKKDLSKEQVYFG